MGLDEFLNQDHNADIVIRQRRDGVTVAHLYGLLWDDEGVSGVSIGIAGMGYSVHAALANLDDRLARVAAETKPQGESRS